MVPATGSPGDDPRFPNSHLGTGLGGPCRLGGFFQLGCSVVPVWPEPGVESRGTVTPTMEAGEIIRMFQKAEVIEGRAWGSSWGRGVGVSLALSVWLVSGPCPSLAPAPEPRPRCPRWHARTARLEERVHADGLIRASWCPVDRGIQAMPPGHCWTLRASVFPPEHPEH